ncbi:LytR/AlgR family response regulator transcription factor [Aquimarina hainanensis]|uniref:LytR/AlgR family response regulator transcription factor n=1 Tax=Aquimarina hainanensis TaxID=1578017 RepID=A0ABW5NBA9_9FLAO|nr:LytTR family DNA-binding domain-containing protein [Aquimarina sp. TRL1]QKX03703.1 response regulator transcription factor [Aquimarina sp. TRL1]
MKCIIIEDELPAQQLLTNFIERTSYVECIGVYESATDLPLSVMKEADFLFLDMQLPEINGLDFLKSLDEKPRVIITTAYRDYAIDAFEEAVEDYLLKPFSYSRFLKAVHRIQKAIAPEERSQENPEIFVYADKTFHKIRKTDIDYIKAEVDYVSIVGDGIKILIQDSMNNWEEKLKPDGFVRVHRSYIVNFNKIEKVEGNRILIKDHAISIGKTYISEFFKRIKE